MKFYFVLVCAFCLVATPLLAQDSLLIKTLQENRYEFAPEADGFSGEGWTKITTEAQQNQYTLIGETHGINEIPMLINGLTKDVQYKTFVAEIDPWLAQILEDKSKLKNPEAQQKWFNDNNSFLSFYSYKQDIKLLQTLAEGNIKLTGIDQITLLNDVPVYEHLSNLTKDKKRKAQYQKMASTSRQMYADYGAGKSKELYLPSENFSKDLQELRAQKLSAKEMKILDALELSHQIYTQKGSHARRINLMKQQLMDIYQKGLLNEKTLFRLGAMHSSRAESYLTLFDIGNLAHNLANSQNSNSYHVAVFPKSGETGIPFKGKPAAKVSQHKELSELYKLASDTDWTYFDLKPLRKHVEKQKLTIDNDFLLKTIKGYDGLIIVPESTAGEF